MASSDSQPSRRAVVAKEMRQSTSDSLRITLRKISLSAERRLEKYEPSAAELFVSSLTSRRSDNSFPRLLSNVNLQPVYERQYDIPSASLSRPRLRSSTNCWTSSVLYRYTCFVLLILVQDDGTFDDSLMRYIAHSVPANRRLMKTYHFNKVIFSCDADELHTGLL